VKLCLPVMIGVHADGRKELVALSDGYRESAGSWADLLRDCRRRGMTAPVPAVGDGALGFWKAMRELFPGTREQRCWHKQANVLAALPKSAYPGALAAMREIDDAEGIDNSAVNAWSRPAACWRNYLSAALKRTCAKPRRPSQNFVSEMAQRYDGHR
jgi:putative transposase